ncbi:MAG TPA: helix-turn-helix domain-containing protein [Candidatus Acidoferrales bacterium]
MKSPRRARGSQAGGREQVLALLADNWAIAMLQALDRGPKLYPQIEREFAAASHTALAETLRNLQDAGLVWRKAYPTSPARVEYSLTYLGKSFIAPLQVLCEWAEVHERELSAAAARRTKQATRKIKKGKTQVGTKSSKREKA